MGLFSWLFGGADPQRKHDVEQSIGIDCSGPDFHDFYPTVDEIAERLRSLDLLKHEAERWIAEVIADRLRSGNGYGSALQAVVRAGKQVTADSAVKAGFGKRKIVGDQFVAALRQGRGPEAENAISRIISACSSRATMLHNLRRYADLGIRSVTFSGPNDERATGFEVEMDGRTLSIMEAKKLVLARSDDMQRSVLSPVVEFEGVRFNSRS